MFCQQDLECVNCIPCKEVIHTSKDITYKEILTDPNINEQCLPTDAI